MKFKRINIKMAQKSILSFQLTNILRKSYGKELFSIIMLISVGTIFVFALQFQSGKFDCETNYEEVVFLSIH